VIDHPSCQAVAVGGGWLRYGCWSADFSTPTWKLYGLASGQWRTLPHTPPCDPSECPATPLAVGSQWVEYTVSCGPHCAASTQFENIYTGQAAPSNLSAYGPGSRENLDLDSPTLLQKLCAPLRVPSYRSLGGPYDVPGTLTFYGPFAVAQTLDGAGNSVNRLERCGSSLHQTLSALGTPEGNSHLLVWWQNPLGVLRGLFLPSRRPFELTVPSGLARAPFLYNVKPAVGPRHFSVGQWQAPLPAPPR
jgi:hypothetical protein